MGIAWQTSPGPVLDRVVIQASAYDALRIEDDGSTGGTAQLTDLTLSYSGAEGLQVGPRMDVTLLRSKIFLNQTGIHVLAGGGLDAFNNVVVGNIWGLRLNQAGASVIRIINNTIDRNVPNYTDPLGSASGRGIWVNSAAQSSQLIVRNNIVTNHGEAGIFVSGGVSPALDTNNVWQNGSNYVGATAGANSISVNPLYVQPLGPGSLAPIPGVAWRFQPDPLTIRVTSNNYNNTWSFDQASAVEMRLIVTYMRSETNYDYLRILNGSGGQVQSFTGLPSMPTTTTSVTGSQIQARYTTDGSGYVTGAGFDISGYEWLPGAVSFNYRLQASSPAIDLGNDLDAPLEDADGTTRPYDGDVNGTATTDLGAYEWHQNIAPMAVAGPDLTILPGTQVSFDATPSNDPDGTIVSWDWDFGDGNTATTEQASNTFSSLGTFTVTLIVTDDQAATGSDTAVITVADNLAPVADAGVDLFASVGEVVNFDGTGSADPDGTIVGYAWDFGDGSPAGSGPTVNHTFGSNGVYTATLTVTDDRGLTHSDTTSVVIGGGSTNLAPTADAGGPYGGQAGAQITFDGSASSDTDGSIAGYAWDFGDGNNGTGVGPTHTYAAAGAYLVTLTVTDDGGLTDNASVLANITTQGNDAPLADAGGPYTADLGAAVTFDGGGSSDPDGSIAAYAWDYGDGNTGTAVGPSHTYAAAGSYLVTLTVTDDAGATATDTTLASVSSPGNTLPVASITAPGTASIGESVLFDGSASSDSDGSIVAYAWDYGDGGTGTGAQASHAFTAAGAYLVRLTVTDDGGAIGQDVHVITIGGSSNQPPVADAGGTQRVDLGSPVLLNGADSIDPDGSIVSHEWDLGDGTTQSGEAVTKTYAAAGSYLVKLTVTDDQGATDEDFALIEVVAPEDNGPAADGCGCSAPGRGEGGLALAFAFLGLALLGRRR